MHTGPRHEPGDRLATSPSDNEKPRVAGDGDQSAGRPPGCERRRGRGLHRGADGARLARAGRGRGRRPGRGALAGAMELLGRQPLVVLDCAHNVASASAVVETLCSSFAPTRRLLIFAGSSDKDVAGMFRVLAPQFEHAFLTRYTDNPRAIPQEDLAAMSRAVERGAHNAQRDACGGMAGRPLRRAGGGPDLRDGIGLSGRGDAADTGWPAHEGAAHELRSRARSKRRTAPPLTSCAAPQFVRPCRFIASPQTA